MNILLVSSYLPYPLFSGGHIRLYNLLRELSQKHKITLICEKRDYQTGKDIERVKKFCRKVITIPRKKQWSLENIIKTAFSFYPFLIVGHTLPEMKKKIQEELDQGNYDLIHVETFYVMQNLPRTATVRGLPIVLAEQNIEHLVYKRFADRANPILRPLLDIDVLKMKYWEKKFWEEADQLVVMSENDKKVIGQDNVSVVPNGADINKFRKLEVSRQRRASPKAGSKKLGVKTILFIGDFKWLQNRDAVEWLLTAIWPLLKSKIKNQKSKIRLWVVGKKIPDSIRHLTDDPDVIFDENAGDTAAIFKRADLLLAPIRAGGGTSFKILEAMATAVPVVTTQLGIEGIETQDGREVLIGRNMQELVDKTIAVLEDQVLYKKLAQSARSLIEEKYDWKIIVRKLEKVYQLVTRQKND